MSPVVSAAGQSVGSYGEYQGYTELPSEQAMAYIQEMTQLDNGGYGDREFRAKPGGGPGLGEIETPLNFEWSNILILAFSGAAFVSFKMYRNKRKQAING
jgi:hypothetical protein